MLKTIIFDSPMFFKILCQMAVIISLAPKKQTEEKRRMWAKSLLGIVSFAAVNILDYCLVDASNASTAIQPLISFPATLLYAVWGLGMRGKAALYCNVWAYLITETVAQTVLPSIGGFPPGSEMLSNIVSFILYLCVVIFVAYLVKKYLSTELMSNNHYHVGRQKLLAVLLVAAVYTVLANYQFIFWLLGYEPEEQSHMIATFRLIVGIAGLIFLFMENSIEKRQMAERELDMFQQLWYRQQGQFRLSQENIDLINRKCHDLKYQVEALQKLSDGAEMNAQLKEMERAVMIYDSVVKTGNPVLDTVLTEKSLYCEAHQINMTCMADGKKLDFVGNVDLYTMFGNALDNAIESVMKQEDPEKRVIQVAVFHEKNLLLIRVRNYCEEKPIFENGLPISSKKDKKYHGFGLKSIRYTAEKYGGGIVCQAADNYFVLQILLPIPERP